MSNQKTGLFAVGYGITSTFPYEPNIILHLFVDTEKQTISGCESLTINLEVPKVVINDDIYMVILFMKKLWRRALAKSLFH